MYRVENYPEIQNNFFLKGRNIGASKKLKGSVAFITIYMYRNSKCWKTDSMDSYAIASRDAISFLEREARRYGTQLKIEKYSLKMNTTPDADPFDEFDLVKDFLNSQNMDEVQRYYEGSLKVNEAPILLAFDERARSFSRKKRANDRYQAEELSVIFKSNKDFTAFTIAHELLHQFGAVDYYFPKAVTSVAEKYFGDSVMGIGNMVVDDLTAYLVGWKDTISASTYWFLRDTMWLTDKIYYEELEKEWKNKF